MTNDEAHGVIATVLSGIAPEVDLTTCDTGAPMTRELDLDSMDVLALLAGIAEASGVDIPESDVEPEWSIDDLAAHLVAG